MWSMFLDCMSSSCVLYTQCCRCLCWVHKTQYEDIQSRNIDNIGYTRHRTKTYNPETSTTLGTQDTERRHTIQRYRQHWVHNVVDISGLYVFVLCLVYPMLSMSLDCMSSFCVLCTQCCRCLCIVCLRPVYCVPSVVDVSGLYTKTYNPETSTTLGTHYTGRRHTIQRHRQHWVHNTQYEDIQSRDIDNIGYTIHRTKTYNPDRPVSCVPSVVDVSGLYVFVMCLVYPMLSISLDCMSSYNPETSTTLGTQYTGRRHTIQRHRQHWVHNTQDEDIQSRDIDNVPNVVDVSGLYVFVLCIVYPMFSMSLDCMSSSCVLCTQCCRCLWIVCLRPVYCVPNVHNTQDEDIQYRDIDNIGYTRHRTKTYNLEISTTLGIQDT
jgi:hypothetical protein